jgi:nitroreductase
MDAKKIEETLQVPEGIRVVELTPLGYPDEQPKVPKRRELSEIVFHEKYGQHQPSKG